MIKTDRYWTLFLDRDGVINRKREGDYVKRWEEFEFLPGAREAIRLLNQNFGKIILVTNQQGIGKGIFTREDLQLVHDTMCAEIEKSGGEICRIYYAPYLESDNHPDRKPGTGMAMRAKSDYPDIDFSRSVMVGDSITDMKFGKDAGMITVFISRSLQKPDQADYMFQSLIDFASWLNLPGAENNRPLV